MKACDSIDEFLEAMHFEGLISFETLRHLVCEVSPLRRIWAKLREFYHEAGDIGEYPSHQIVIGTQEPLANTVIRLPEKQVAEAAEAWSGFEAGDYKALASPYLGGIMSEFGASAGERLRLNLFDAIHFGDWLSVVITDCSVVDGNDAIVLKLEEIAANAAYGNTKLFGTVCKNPTVWEKYQPAVTAVVSALKEKKIV